MQCFKCTFGVEKFVKNVLIDSATFVLNVRQSKSPLKVIIRKE